MNFLEWSRLVPWPFHFDSDEEPVDGTDKVGSPWFPSLDHINDISPHLFQVVDDLSLDYTFEH